MSISRSPQLRSLLACLVIANCGGCGAVAVGAASAGAVAYVRGSEERTYQQPIDTVYAATVAALAESEFKVTQQNLDQFKGNLTGVTATGDRITIALASQGAATAINLQVNAFGDKPITQGLLHRIEQNLHAGSVMRMADAASGPAGNKAAVKAR